MEPMKKDEMQGKESRPTEAYDLIRRGGSDELDDADRFFHRFHVQICAVIKNRTPEKVEAMLTKNPEIRDLAENRWPDLETNFRHFSNYKRHFIGPLQTNKIKKILPFVEVIQSVDRLKLLPLLQAATAKPLEFCFQINISRDPKKHGLLPEELPQAIEHYLSANYSKLKLIGLMTIVERAESKKRLADFQAMRQLFDQINAKYFHDAPLPTLSMGMSEDQEQAKQAGATMLRLGTVLFV